MFYIFISINTYLARIESINMSNTHLAYHHDSSLHTYQTTATSITSFSNLPEPTRALFQERTDEYYVVITAGTIFHPQGDGQPSVPSTPLRNLSLQGK